MQEAIELRPDISSMDSAILLESSPRTDTFIIKKDSPCSDIVDFEASRSHLYCNDLKARVIKELRILKSFLLYFLLCVFLIVYIISTVARNLAYYYDSQNLSLVVLPDRVFEILPTVSESWLFVPEIFSYSITTLFFSFIFAQIFFTGSELVMPIVLKFLYIFTFGHVARMFLYLTTTLPSPSFHCDSLDPKYNPPGSLLDVFLQFKTFGNLNCGDLMFSGHFFITLLCVLSYFEYGQTYLAPKWHYRGLAVFSLLLSGQLFFILLVHNHYTVDILVTLYFIPCLYFVVSVLFPLSIEYKYKRPSLFKYRKEVDE